MKIQNSEAIFETIGNYPVVDQFDVLYSGMLSGSIYDNYVTGSLLKKQFGGTITIEGERGLAFNRLGNNSQKFPNDQANEKSYEYKSWGERSGIVKFLKIFSPTERFYDSVTPKIDQMISRLNGSIEEIFSFSAIFLGSSNNLLPPADTATPFKFVESFPFEPIFFDVEKINRVSPKAQQKNIVVVVNNGTAINDIVWKNLKNSPLGDDALEDKEISNIFFGFGDVNLRYEDSGDYYGSKNFPDHRFEDSSAGITRWYSPIIRGWKYGLIDANPRYTSAVFRRDKFGQLRDMLEQRYSATTISDAINSPVTYSGFLDEPAPIPRGQIIENQSNTPDFAVTVSFVKQTILYDQLIYIGLAPGSTQSSNLSMHMSSSLPYFDGESKN